MTLKTVRIVATDEATQGKYVIVNEEDFDEKTMKLYDGPDNPEPASASAPLSVEAMAAELAELKATLAKLTAGDTGADGWNAPPKAGK